MSETVIFIIGSIVWAITVAGTVLAGGYLLGDSRRAQAKRRSGGASDQGD